MGGDITHIKESRWYGYNSKGQKLAKLQKAYLRNHIHKPNKLSIKNTATRLQDANIMLACFLVQDNNPMADDELCGILYWMVKHK
eukprot:2719989-Ditylum_brightwellii.AAC.2